MAQPSKVFDLSSRATASARNAQAAPVFVPTGTAAVTMPEEMPALEGPRKLVRPQLPKHLAQPPIAPRRLRGDAPLAQHAGRSARQRSLTAPIAGHAESLYLQKQMQAQTVMVFLLEGGEQLQGVIEWFDRDTIKIRNATRVLIYKHSIKYLYKAYGDHSV